MNQAANGLLIRYKPMNMRNMMRQLLVVSVFLMLPMCVVCAQDTLQLTIETAPTGDTIHLSLAGGGNVVIAWGDGSAKQSYAPMELYFVEDGSGITATSLSGDPALHVYAAAGKKTITVTGYITGIITGGRQAVTAIDVRQMDGLLVLDCSNEALTTIDVSENTELMTFDCSNNQLTEVVLTNHASLMRVDCRDNRMERDALAKLLAGLQRCTHEYGGMLSCKGNPGFTTLTENDIAAGNNKRWWID